MGDTINSVVGKKIRSIRKEIGLTQKEVADKLGITDSGFAQIERGDNLISLEHLVKLPSILGCRITDILPDSVISDYDQQRAADPRLQEILGAWNDLPEFLKDGMTIMVRDSQKEIGKKR